jgi:hypothetical protein
MLGKIPQNTHRNKKAVVYDIGRNTLGRAYYIHGYHCLPGFYTS